MASPFAFRRLLRLPPSLRRSFWSTASPPPPSNPEIFDVVCVGGGPAGLSLASALRSNPSTSGLRIALIDGQDLTTCITGNDPSDYSNRCSSLTPASVKFLRDTGAWDHVDAARTQPYHGMQVWDGVSGSKISFDPLDAKSGAFGGGIIDAVADMIPGSAFGTSARGNGQDGVVATMCENTNLTSALLQHLKGVGGVEMLDKTKVSSIELGPEPENEESLDLSQWPIVNLPGSRQLAARLLIGADGANSPVRNFADIPSHGWDYDQHGVVATLNLDRPFTAGELRTAYQRFLPTGPIALLPLPNNKASLVWSISTPFATKLKSLPPSTLTTLINAALRLSQPDLDYLLKNASTINIEDEISWRIPHTSPATTGQPLDLPTVTSIQEATTASFPLRLRHASTYTSHRTALLGDAAHTIHPLAGQGLNLGLADSLALASRIAYGLEHGMDIGTCWCLDDYNADRWGKNNAVMGVCDKLQKVYSAESGPVVWGRSLGLDVIEKLGGLKGQLMRGAGG